MTTEIPKENVEMTKDNYLLENNRSYKILLLYILRTLNNDIKQKIFKILISEELILELEETSHLKNRYWIVYQKPLIIKLIKRNLGI